MQDVEKGRKYGDIIALFQQAGIGRVTNSYFTITMSEGVNLNIETTALATLAWLNDQDRYAEEIEAAINYITSLVQLGQYGTTQATILSLKAITKYMNNFSDINGNGFFSLYVNDELVQMIEFTPENKSAINFDIQSFIDSHAVDYFAPGEEVVFRVAIENYTEDTSFENVFSNEQSLGFKLSYSMNLAYYDQRPPSGNASLLFNVTSPGDKDESIVLGSNDMLG